MYVCVCAVTCVIGVCVYACRGQRSASGAAHLFVIIIIIIIIIIQSSPQRDLELTKYHELQVSAGLYLVSTEIICVTVFSFLKITFS